MKMMLRSLLFGLLLLPGFSQAQNAGALDLFMRAQEKFAADNDYFGVMRWERKGGETLSGNFWVKGEMFRLQLEDREIVGDGTFTWEIIHRDQRIKKRHYDPLEAPAVVHAVRMLRVDLTSEHVTTADNGKSLSFDIETASSVEQGNHIMTIDPKTLNIASFDFQVNQGEYLERVEIGQFQSELKFADETFTVNVDDWKRKGYTLLDLAKGDNPAVYTEEKVLTPR